MNIMRAGAHLRSTGFWRKATRFASDRRGLAAVEFALIMPLLMVMYFVTMEASQAIETSKKVSRIGGMVADLVTQQASITKADIDAIMAIGAVTLKPYDRSDPSITITAIKITSDASPVVQVAWSRKLVNGVASAGPTTTTVPATLKVAGTFLIRVDSALGYKPVITWAAGSQQKLGLSTAFNNIAMGETYYLRPRRSLSLPCGDC